MGNDVTRDTIERELERDLKELTSGTKKSSQKKTVKKTDANTAEKKEGKKSERGDSKVEHRVQSRVPPKNASVSMDALLKKEQMIDEKKPEMGIKISGVSDEQESSSDDARSKRIFFGAIAAIIIIFVALIIGGKYLPSGGINPVNAQSTMYNGYTFVKSPTHWVFQWQNKDVVYSIPLRFLPQETEQVPITGALDPRFNEFSPVYIVFDPTSEQSNFTYLTLAAVEASFSLAQTLDKNVESACAVDDGAQTCANRTIVDCSTSENKAVIYLKTEAPTSVIIDGTCIIVQGKGMELLRALERVLYSWYGIIV